MSIKDRLSKIRISPVIGVILILAAVFKYTYDTGNNKALSEAAGQVRYVASQPIAALRMANNAIILPSQDTNEAARAIVPFIHFQPEAVSNLVSALQHAQPAKLPADATIADTWHYALLFTNKVYAPFIATIYEDMEDDVYVSFLNPVRITDGENETLQITTNLPALLPGAAPYFRETVTESDKQMILMMESLRAGGEKED